MTTDYSLSRLEQETTITFNEEEKTASIFTYNKRLQRKLAQLAKERPDQCRLESEDKNWKHQVYIIPKNWIKVNANRILSDHMKEKMRGVFSKNKSQPSTPDSKREISC